MTPIRVVYSGQLRTAVGRSSEEVELASPPTVAHLLDRLVEVHGPAVGERILAGPGQLRTGILLCVGATHIGDDLSQRLSEGDEVTILMAISGG